VKIVFTSGVSPNATIVTLGDSASGLPVQNFRVNGRREVQVNSYLRSKWAEPMPRKNRINRVTFEATQLHETVEEALLFKLKHPDSIPDSGRLDFSVSADGSTESELTMNNACIEDVSQIDDFGCTTVWSYSFVGGEITGG